MQNCLLKCDLIAWSFLICTSVSCMCCLTFAWAFRFFSRFEEVQRRQRSGPAGICRQTHFPLFLSLSLSLTHTLLESLFLSQQNLSSFSLSRLGPGPPPFPLIMLTSSVIGPFTGQWKKETHMRRNTHTHSQNNDFPVSKEFKPCRVN